MARLRRKPVVKQGSYCLDQTETISCNLDPCNPMSPELQIAAKVIQVLGCTWLIGMTTASFSFSIIFWVWNTNRVLQASQDLSLLLAHIIIALARSETKNFVVCTLAGFSLQYFFLVNFVCILLEAFHVFTIVTSVVQYGTFFTTKFNIWIGWGSPAVIVGLTGLFFHNHYTSKFSCWLNLEHYICVATIVPVFICSGLAMVMLESAGQFHVQLLCMQNSQDSTSARISQRSLLFILPFNVVAWLIGLIAIFEQNFALFTTVFGLNIALGVNIVVFHMMANEKLRYWFVKISKKFHG